MSEIFASDLPDYFQMCVFHLFIHLLLMFTTSPAANLTACGFQIYDTTNR